jgi:hypothetical protein
VPNHLIKGFKAIILGLGHCVFDGEPPNLDRALLLASEELHFWGFAGVRGINHLLAQGLFV